MHRKITALFYHLRKKWLQHSESVRINWLFAFIGLGTICVLTAVKASKSYHEVVPKKQTYHAMPRLSIDTDLVELSTHVVCLMKKPVTNHQYWHFVNASGYISWRERQHLTPTWRYPQTTTPSWEIAPEEPVLWLVREDAEAFCQWLARQAQSLSAYDRSNSVPLWQCKGFRLPTVEELQQQPHPMPLWEWSCEDLAHYDHTLVNAHQYLTAWHPQHPLRHRRTSDMGDRDIEATSFRVAWTSFTRGTRVKACKGAGS